MRSIEVDLQFRLDPRFKKLCRAVGDEDKALGMCIRAWGLAAQHWEDGRRLIPFDLWELEELEHLEAAKLARRDLEGVYVCGTIDRCEWAARYRESRKKGGEARAAKAAREQNSGRFRNVTTSCPPAAPQQRPASAGDGTSSSQHEPATSSASASASASSSSPAAGEGGGENIHTLGQEGPALDAADLEADPELELDRSPPPGKAGGRRRAARARTVSWPPGDPLAKAFEHLAAMPSYAAVFDAPYDRGILQRHAAHYGLELTELVEICFQLRNWAEDRPQLKKPRATLSTFVQNFVRRRASGPRLVPPPPAAPSEVPTLTGGAKLW